MRTWAVTPPPSWWPTSSRGDRVHPGRCRRRGRLRGRPSAQSGRSPPAAGALGRPGDAAPEPERPCRLDAPRHLDLRMLSAVVAAELRFEATASATCAEWWQLPAGWSAPVLGGGSDFALQPLLAHQRDLAAQLRRGVVMLLFRSVRTRPWGTPVTGRQDQAIWTSTTRRYADRESPPLLGRRGCSRGQLRPGPRRDPGLDGRGRVLAVAASGPGAARSAAACRHRCPRRWRWHPDRPACEPGWGSIWVAWPRAGWPTGWQRSWMATTWSTWAATSSPVDQDRLVGDGGGAGPSGGPAARIRELPQQRPAAPLGIPWPLPPPPHRLPHQSTGGGAGRSFDGGRQHRHGGGPGQDRPAAGSRSRCLPRPAAQAWLVAPSPSIWSSGWRRLPAPVPGGGRLATAPSSLLAALGAVVVHVLLAGTDAGAAASGGGALGRGRATGGGTCAPGRLSQ